MFKLQEYLADVPKLHTWDGGQTWSTGGFSSAELEDIYKFCEKTLGPKASFLETGAGNSTCVFLALDPREVVSIAPDRELFGRISSSLEKFGINSGPLNMICERSEIALPRLAVDRANADSKDFDLFLIDGLHAWPTVFVDLCYGNMMLREDGLLIVDDYPIFSVKQMARFVAKDPAYELIKEMKKTLIFQKKTKAKYFGWHYSNLYIKESSVDHTSKGLFD